MASWVGILVPVDLSIHQTTSVATLNCTSTTQYRTVLSSFSLHMALFGWLGLLNIWTALLFNATAHCFVLVGTSLSSSQNGSSSNNFPLQASSQSQEVASSSGAMKDTGKDPLIRNFRQAAGLKRIYRCANTDSLGNLFENDAFPSSSTLDKNSPENILLHKAGLILDLRSNSERKETQAQTWMTKAPGGKIVTKYFERDAIATNYNVADTSERSVYRIDVLSPKRLFDYLSNNWVISPVQKAQYTFSLLFDTQQLHEMRMDILNERGLKGLYEAIIETSREELFASLKAITEYLENNDTGDVIVHCVQGKDR